MPETLSRSSPFTGTLLPEGKPFWIVDGRAYDFTEWMTRHPGGAMWFRTSQGRDISALVHTYHRDPARLQKILGKYEIEGFTQKDILPKMGIPPFLLAPEFDATTDLPRLDYGETGSLLASIRQKVNARLSKQALRKHDRAFDLATLIIGLAHVATLALLIAGVMPAWAFVAILVVTRTALAGAGHYHLHRKWRDGGRFTLPIGKALFDINYVGTSLIGTDGHVLLHHPYLGSGADVKKTFFDGMLRLHPVLRIPGYTMHKFGICLLGLPLRAREIGRFEVARDDSKRREAIRADFWFIRAWMTIEFVACLATGHIVAWLVQFILTLWFNTFLVVASHDFEESGTEEELAAIPEPLRGDWAAHQICLSYDLSIVGNRWVDLFLSAGLSPHRVHHVLPFQGSGFANLASENAVKEACAEVGISWQRPRNLIFDRFPAVMKHYLLCPAILPPPGAFPLGPPPPGASPMPPPPPGTFPAGPPPGFPPGPPPQGFPPGPPPQGFPPGPPPQGFPPGPPPGASPAGSLPPGPLPMAGPPRPAGAPAPGAFPAGPPPPGSAPPEHQSPLRRQLAEFVRYSFDGWRGVGV